MKLLRTKPLKLEATIATNPSKRISYLQSISKYTKNASTTFYGDVHVQIVTTSYIVFGAICQLTQQPKP